MEGSGKKAARPVRIAFAAIVVLLSAVCFEGAARLAYKYKDRLQAGGQDLDPYEMADPRHPGHWRLVPGYSQTLRELVEYKRKEGKTLGLKYLEERAKTLGFEQDDLLFRVNRDGFKGPEIDHAHSRVRILAIGDSCTFGTYFDRHSYPRVLERELAQRGKDVEVVNAGVEGYSPRNVLLRIDEFQALRPEVTTIYIGWNALYSVSNVLTGAEKRFFGVRLIKRGYERMGELVRGRRQDALAKLRKKKRPDREGEDVRALDGFAPPFMEDVLRIIERMQAAGSRVAVVTLPGLYVMEETPSERALDVGHLPGYTDNPYVLAKLCRQYNIALREAARKSGARVIDLEAWSGTALVPRDRFFFDSVHLYEEGQERIGKRMAEELMPIIR